MTLTSDAKCEEKLTCGLENDKTNMANIHHAIESLKIAIMMGTFN